MAKRENPFDRVMRYVTAYYRARFERESGVKTWLAGQLGITKQAINNFQKTGHFPNGYIHKISALTLIPVRELIGDIDAAVAAYAKREKMTIEDARAMLIWIGVETLNRQ